MILGVSSRVVPTLNGVDVSRLSRLWVPFALLNAGFEHLDVPTETRRPALQVAGRPSVMPVAQAAEPVRAPAPPPAPRGRQPVMAWSIQVGSFPTERQAREAAAMGRRAAEGGEVRIESATVSEQIAQPEIEAGLPFDPGL